MYTINTKMLTEKEESSDLFQYVDVAKKNYSLCCCMENQGGIGAVAKGMFPFTYFLC